MSENQPKQSRLGPVAGVGRRIQVAGVVIIAILVGLGYGYARPAASASTAHSALSATTSPVDSAEVVCPVVKDLKNTNITTFTPTTVAGTGTAVETVTQLSQSSSSGQSKTILTAGAPGTLASAQGVSGSSLSINDPSDPVVAKVSGPDAPGFTVTESLAGGSGAEAGVASENCGSPDTDFWFTGLGTDKDPFALLNLVNADSIPASVNITVYTTNGALTGNSATALQGVTLTAGSESYELISTLAGNQNAPYAVHVVATVGRVSAAVLDYDGDNTGRGRDFIGAQKAASTLVMPGIPQAEDNEKVELSLLAPDGPASVSLRWVGKSTITPATGSFSGELDEGKVTTVDLSTVANAGEYAALEVCGSSSGANQCLPVTGDNGPTDVVGEVEITQSDNSGQDTAYITPVSALTGDGIVADNPLASVLTLTNTGTSTATVKVTLTPNGKSPTPVTSTVTVPAGTTVAQPLTTPKGASDYALTVTPVSGSVYAARIAGTGHQLTIQSMSTAAETVTIPAVDQDVSGLVPQN
ncbi:DUF756 domain-containing protein [Actinospica durhamensis]|uniref:DUF756 domain-containing protein n=1 Tax=Actinospica durhamensis TaxID=1508375 RepID=A0A941ERC7_9ACTN|nr:DUF5719 family protein [Actinospica durhamensis]MBR7835098.1 DUF756 domain-containing protein [Actinospica durhamensis]